MVSYPNHQVNLISTYLGRSRGEGFKIRFNRVILKLNIIPCIRNSPEGELRGDVGHSESCKRGSFIIFNQVEEKLLISSFYQYSFSSCHVHFSRSRTDTSTIKENSSFVRHSAAHAARIIKSEERSTVHVIILQHKNTWIIHITMNLLIRDTGDDRSRNRVQIIQTRKIEEE